MIEQILLIFSDNKVFILSLIYISLFSFVLYFIHTSNKLKFENDNNHKYITEPIDEIDLFEAILASIFNVLFITYLFIYYLIKFYNYLNSFYNPNYNIKYSKPKY